MIYLLHDRKINEEISGLQEVFQRWHSQTILQ